MWNAFMTRTPGVKAFFGLLFIMLAVVEPSAVLLASGVLLLVPLFTHIMKRM